MPEAAPRRPLVVGNWKMHMTVAEARSYIAELGPLLPGHEAVEVGICPPFTALAACVEELRDSEIAVYAQTMHEGESGGHTGEISAPMLTELGVDGVVLGHSERRRDNAETDRALSEKLPAALEAKLRPILCVGETEAERDDGDTERRLRHQVQEALETVPDESLPDVVIAYEPIWAIGSGRSATAEQVQEAIGFIRALVGDRSAPAAERVRVLYGGSVKGENAAELLAGPDVDGALVGGASLEAPELAAIVAAAARISA